MDFLILSTHQDAAVGASVEGVAEGLEALLSSRVPDLHQNGYNQLFEMEASEFAHLFF